MEKVTLGSRTMFYPTPVVVVGSKGNNNDIDFTTIAWAGIVNSEPPMLGIGIRNHRHIHKLISESSVFSVNIPSRDQAVETDFCGLVSGNKVDKAAACHFTLFYGILEKAPLIREFPLNLECSVEKIIKLPSHDYFIAKIIEVYIDKNLVHDPENENIKIDPLVFMGTHYAQTSGNLGKTFSVGKKLIKK